MFATITLYSRRISQEEEAAWKRCFRRFFLHKCAPDAVSGSLSSTLRVRVMYYAPSLVVSKEGAASTRASKGFHALNKYWISCLSFSFVVIARFYLFKRYTASSARAKGREERCAFVKICMSLRSAGFSVDPFFRHNTGGREEGRKGVGERSKRRL